MIGSRHVTCTALGVLLLLAGTGSSRAADSCDALTARMIRATGASLAGRTGPLAVFRAADADRMSLTCGKNSRMVFGAVERLPRRNYFVLIGLPAQGLTGTRPEDVEILALKLHQDSLLADAPREGQTGRAALRCETGPRRDALANDHTVCILVPNRPVVLRRRAALPAAASLG